MGEYFTDMKSLDQDKTVVKPMITERPERASRPRPVKDEPSPKPVKDEPEKTAKSSFIAKPEPKGSEDITNG